jgi:hypothetical protein
MSNFFYGSGMIGYWHSPSWLVFMPILIIWSLFWKALALWHSARRDQPWWFLVLLILNTVGILEIIYLFGVIKLKKEELFPKFKK